MKTPKNFLALNLLLAVLIIGCKKDDELITESLSTEDVNNESRIDKIADDVNLIVDDQYNVASGKYAGTLPACAVVTITEDVAANTWKRTVDFGSTGCSFNGSLFRGKIIITGSKDYLQKNYVLVFSFDNFFHNNWKLDGVRTVTRTFDGFPISTIDLNFKITSPTGNEFTRVGKRVRQFIEGSETATVTDNVFSITGSWTTTNAAGIRETTISKPIKWVAACQFKITEGEISIIRKANKAVIDYGNGACDNNATISINGGSPTNFNIN